MTWRNWQVQFTLINQSTFKLHRRHYDKSFYTHQGDGDPYRGWYDPDSIIDIDRQAGLNPDNTRTRTLARDEDWLITLDFAFVDCPLVENPSHEKPRNSVEELQTPWDRVQGWVWFEPSNEYDDVTIRSHAVQVRWIARFGPGRSKPEVKFSVASQGNLSASVRGQSILVKNIASPAVAPPGQAVAIAALVRKPPSECGVTALWRSTDPVEELLKRYGCVEHLVIQIDFMRSSERWPRAEWSIPGASKRVAGNTGYADVVALKSREIWEIKPSHLEATAIREAGHYVAFANVNCGGRAICSTPRCGTAWKLGRGYKSGKKPIIGPEGPSATGLVPIVRFQGPPKVELFAKQGAPGAIIYWWEVNGRAVTVVDKKYIWYLRQAIVWTVFGNFAHGGELLGPPHKAPEDLPPIRWVPISFSRSDVIPEFESRVSEFTKDFYFAGHETHYPTGFIALLLIEPVTFDAIVGPRLMKQRMSWLQPPQPNPNEQDIRRILGILGLSISVPTVLLFGGVVCIMAPELAVPAVAAEAATVGAAGSTAAFWNTLAPSALGILEAGVVVTSSRIAFGTPIAVATQAGATIHFQPSNARYYIVPANLAGAPSHRLGQEITIEGQVWRVAGIARCISE